jgi:hypothetical protein
MGSRPRAVRLAVPATFVAILMLIALWRLSAPMAPASGAASSRPQPLEPLTTIAEVLAGNSIGRRASLERVLVRRVPSARTLWIEADDERFFVVLDPDVRNLSAIGLRPGARVTLIGLVRAAPAPETAVRQWGLDAETAQSLREDGTYLHVTEIHPDTQ